MGEKMLGPYREGDCVSVSWAGDGRLEWTRVSGWTLVKDDGSRASPIRLDEIVGASPSMTSEREAEIRRLAAMPGSCGMNWPIHEDAQAVVRELLIALDEARAGGRGT